MRQYRILLSAAAMAASLLLAAPAFAAGVTADVSARIAGTYTGSNGLGSVSFTLNQAAVAGYTPGATAGKADRLFSDRRTLAASATENLDLAGVLSDPLGAVLTFGHVKAIYIHAAAANTNDVCVGGAAANGFLGPFADATDIACIKPGGALLVTAPAGAGWAVTPSTGDLLKITNSAGTTGVTYDAVIIGTSS